MMHYLGQDLSNGEVIPFLRKALMLAYTTQAFFGGRGPNVFSLEDLTYLNRASGHWPEDVRFHFFRGREEIFRKSEQTLLFWHEYSGLALIDPNE